MSTTGCSYAPPASARRPPATRSTRRSAPSGGSVTTGPRPVPAASGGRDARGPLSGAGMDRRHLAGMPAGSRRSYRSLHRRAGADLVGHLARQELAVLEVAEEGAVLDDDLAAQHRQ